MKIKEEFSQKLLVEGNNDQHIIRALRKRFSLARNFDIVDCGGDTKLLDDFSIYLKQADTTTLAIILDADTDLTKRWEQVKSTFHKKGFSNIPEQIPSTGLVHEEQGKRLGVWLMPNNQLAGKIEDFIRFLIPEEDKLLPQVEKHLNEMESKGLTRYASKDRPKALVHAWLALQESPGTPLGQSITKRYLSVENEVAQVFMKWLKETFNSP